VPGRLHSWGCPVDVDLAARPMYGCSYSCVALSAPRIVMIRLCVSVASMCAGSARGLCIPCLRVVACNRELATYAEMRSYFRLTSMIIEVSSSGHIPCWCYFMRQLSTSARDSARLCNPPSLTIVIGKLAHFVPAVDCWKPSRYTVRPPDQYHHSACLHLAGSDLRFYRDCTGGRWSVVLVGFLGARWGSPSL
jgi:hypothetical protein